MIYLFAKYKIHTPNC